MTTEEYPRVASLTYRIKSYRPHEYRETATFDGEIPGFGVRLRHLSAVFEPRARFETEEAARDALDPLLMLWELHAALMHGTGVISFQFTYAHIQERPPQPNVIEVGPAVLLFVPGEMHITLTRDSYPAFPVGFIVDEGVKTIGELFLLAKEKPTIVLYIAYAMLTLIESEHGSLPAAGRKLGFSNKLLGEVSRIANSRGKGVEARKHRRGLAKAPLTPGERAWLMQIMYQFALRSGAAMAGVSVGEEITLETHPLPAP